MCGRARRAGNASGVYRYGVAAAFVADIVAFVNRRVVDERRRVEVEGVGANTANLNTSPLEREEREERGGSRGGGVS